MYDVVTALQYGVFMVGMDKVCANVLNRNTKACSRCRYMCCSDTPVTGHYRWTCRQSEMYLRH